MKITMIIPIYNESRIIGRMLDQLDALPGDWEIRFADGGSSDDTLAQIGGRYPVIPCPKGRANQMNHAAKGACDVIWFVHCDSILPTDAHAQISRAISNADTFRKIQEYLKPDFLENLLKNYVRKDFLA